MACRLDDAGANISEFLTGCARIMTTRDSLPAAPNCPSHLTTRLPCRPSRSSSPTVRWPMRWSTPASKSGAGRARRLPCHRRPRDERPDAGACIGPSARFHEGPTTLLVTPTASGSSRVAPSRRGRRFGRYLPRRWQHSSDVSARAMSARVPAKSRRAVEATSSVEATAAVSGRLSDDTRVERQDSHALK
jgi:hypothetical protein